MVDLIAIQINGKNDIEANLEALEKQLAKARKRTSAPALAVLPECAALFACSGSQQLSVSESPGNGVVQDAFARMARQYKVYLIGGTHPIKSESSKKYYAASLAYSPTGECISRYDKIHMFDVEVNDATKSYFESKYTMAGTHLAAFDSPWGKVGQCVCYDLRFPSMFAAMMPMNILVVPSAFTRVTGEAHWHALLQARSIELQCYVVAANQVGIHSDGRETFGHTCIYSPWGELLSLIEENEGFASAKFDVDLLEKIRARMPVQSHKKERYQFE